VWTEVFSGIEFTVDIIKSKLATLWQVNSFTATDRQILNPTTIDGLVSFPWPL
jgi:hypothetical protein